MLDRKVHDQLFKLIHRGLAVQAEDFLHLGLVHGHSLFGLETHSPSHDDDLPSVLVKGADHIIIDNFTDFHDVLASQRVLQFSPPLCAAVHSAADKLKK